MFLHLVVWCVAGNLFLDFLPSGFAGDLCVGVLFVGVAGGLFSALCMRAAFAGNRIVDLCLAALRRAPGSLPVSCLWASFRCSSSRRCHNRKLTKVSHSRSIRSGGPILD